jgi:hypothetical protein
MTNGKRQDLAWLWILIGVIAVGLLFFYVGPQIAG